MQGDAGGAVGGALLRRQHPLLPAGPLPVPGHAGTPAQVLLRLDSRWGSSHVTSPTLRVYHCKLHQIVFSEDVDETIGHYPLSDILSD